MMTIELTPEEQRIYDRNTCHGPLPQRSEPSKAAEPTRHPMAGRSPGVRSTSRKALKTVKPTLGRKQAQVLTVLVMHDEPMCDLEILDYLNKSTVDQWKINAVVARRNELMTMGKIEEHNRRKCSHSTTVATIHWAVPEDAR